MRGNCRVVKNKDAWHKFTAKDGYGGDIVLVGSGASTYLSVHTNNPGPKGFSPLSGRGVLRKLAYAILRTVPARSPR